MALHLGGLPVIPLRLAVLAALALMVQRRTGHLEQDDSIPSPAGGHTGGGAALWPRASEASNARQGLIGGLAGPPGYRASQSPISTIFPFVPKDVMAKGAVA